MESPDTKKKIVRVTIFNQSYSVLAPGEPEATEVLARSVDELMVSIARRAGNLDTTRTAVLACLHLADRLQRCEQELASLQDEVREKTRDFAMVLDQAFDSVLDK
jgi:cell division protein ZapA